MIERNNNENFLEYAERLLSNRKEYDLDKVEVYEILYGEQVSADHARKCLTNLEKTIEENKKICIDKQIHNDFNNNELTNNYKTTTEINKDGSQTSEKLIHMSEEQSKDINFLLNSHGFDKNIWELISARNNIWNSYSKKDGVLTLYSSKIAVKPKLIPTLDKKQLKIILDSLIKNYIIPTFNKNDYKNIGDILILNISDLHYGLKAYMETSNNLYDTQIATNRFLYVINDVINRVKDKQIKKVMLLNLGDICNFDTPYQTTKGTPQPDSAVNWYSMFKEVCGLLIKGIDMLLNVAPVEVWNCNSNHDRYTTFSIFEVLKAWYKNNSNVFIDTETLDRKYIKYGKSLIGIAHDIDEKKAYKIIHTEAKEYISDSNYIYWFVAHFHKSMVIDDYGVEIRRLPTASGDSEWTYKKGYCGTIKKWESYILSEDYGIVDIMNTVIK